MSRPTLTMFLLLLSAAARAAEPTDHHVEINLARTRWQPLPQTVYNVYVAPDARLWYELDCPSPSADPAQLKAMIEHEFAQPAPQLYGAMPILFEPGGRVWFRGWGALQRTLFGYDGKTWIEHPLQLNHALRGVAPNHGRPRPGYANLFVDGVAFFIDNLGVEQFDGTTWTYRGFYERPPNGPSHPLLEVEPDGKGVVALVTTKVAAAIAAEDAGPQLWRRRKGKWTQSPSPGALGRFWRFAPVPDGIVTLTLSGDLRFHPYDPSDPRAFASVLKQLDHDDPIVRDQAANALAGMGESVIPALEKLLASAQSPEAITHLQSILANLRSGEQPAFSVFGPYRLKQIQMLEYLADRTLCLAAGAISDARGNDLGPGLLLQPPQGELRFLPGEALCHAFDFMAGDLSGPILAGDSRVWLPPVTRGVSSAANLVDLKAAKIIATLPDARYRILQAARADGTLFAMPDHRSNIMVFTPAAAPAPAAAADHP